MPATSLDLIVALAKRRGFVFPSSDLYGGFSAAYDYGHYGVLLRRRIEQAWLDAMSLYRSDIVLLDSAIIQHPETWIASGHAGNFSDPLVECATCQQQFRGDHQGEIPCPMKPSQVVGQGPNCHISDEHQFQLMFEIAYGAQKKSAAKAWLRPETAQGIFTAFPQVIRSQRVKLPFGIAQVGKSFRNEITTRQFVFRMREFTQMEMEWFCPENSAPEWYQFWRETRFAWWRDTLGLDSTRLRLRDHTTDELAHYSTATADIEYNFPIGWQEVEGVAYRGDHDLQAHARHSGKDLSIRDPESGEKIIPHVIEPAAGLDRAFLAVLAEAYDEDDLGSERRVVLRIRPQLAPISAAVLPLVRKDGQPEQAAAIHQQLTRAGIRAEFDVAGHIGKRYRRQDEIGTPWCLTIDHQSLADETITVRDRDTLEQIRLPITGINEWLTERLS